MPQRLGLAKRLLSNLFDRGARRIVAIVVGISITFGSSVTSHATRISYINSAQDSWLTAANWSPANNWTSGTAKTNVVNTDIRLNIGIASPNTNMVTVTYDATMGTTAFDVSTAGGENRSIVVGASAEAASGTLNINGGTLRCVQEATTPCVLIGAGITAYSASSFVNVNGGTFDCGSSGIIGLLNSGSGSPVAALTISSGSINAGTIEFGAGSTLSSGSQMSLNLNGGQTTVSTISLLPAGGAATTSVNINGGQLNAAVGSTTIISGAATSGSYTVNLSNNPANTFNIPNDVTTAIAAPMAGPGGFTKAGAGSLILSSANTYTGNTTINAGTLALSGSGTLASLNISVATNATFDVSGVTGGSYTLSGSGTLTLKINKTSSTLTSGQVAASSITAGGVLTVTANGDALADGNTFTLFNVTPSGTFSATPFLAGGANWYTTDNYQHITYNVWPTAGSPGYSHAKGTQWKILVSDLLTNVTGAVSGKTITLTGVGSPTVSGATAQIYGGYVIYTPGSGDANDSFSYSVSDGRGGSATGTVNVTVDTSGVFGQQSPQMTADGNGNIIVKFFGVPGYSYTVQKATDLTANGGLGDWVDYAPFNCTTSSPSLSITNNVGVGNQAYFRLKY